MSDFTQWKWSPNEPWKVRQSEIIQYFSDTERFISCPICPHNGQWTMHVDQDWGNTGPDPYMIIYHMNAYSPMNLNEPKFRAGHFAIECPKCGHMELIPCAAVAKYFDRKTKERDNGAQ